MLLPIDDIKTANWVELKIYLADNYQRHKYDGAWNCGITMFSNDVYTTDEGYAN